MILSAASSPAVQSDASTWVFLGVLGGATAGVLAGWARSIRAWQPPRPCPDLEAPDRFYAHHGRHDELDLGPGWRSLDDPHAIWHLWWEPGTYLLLGVRSVALPPPSYGVLGGWRNLATSSARGLGGMKVLGSLLRADRRHLDYLRPFPDGLDRLCGGTGAPPAPGSPPAAGDDTSIDRGHTGRHG